MKIGLFDSGIGGLTVLAQLVKRMPNAEYLYVADTKNAPFGVKSREEILRISTRVIDFLAKQGAECVVTACNTADASIRMSGCNFRIPYFGILDFELPESFEKVVVIATEFTAKSGVYGKILRTKGVKECLELPCQSFVKIVEDGLTKSSLADQEIEKCLSPIRDIDIQILVFGCTHFPFLAERIRLHFPNLRFFDPAESVAEKVARSLAKDSFNDGKVNFYVTGDLSSFVKKVEKHKSFFALDFCVQSIDLEA
ncbi:glutamate racemase [Pseudothermotoga sp. U03pept]|uniref:glutamate racemase n=1 Tax=Pseudothermotoga sp. U03pept TaxID=3447012 RepID=UPI003F04034F